MEYKNREEVPAKYKWDLSYRYKDIETWNDSLNHIENKMHNIEKYRGKIMESPESLYNLLEEYFKYENEIIRLLCYIECKLDENLSDKKSIQLDKKMKNLYTSFFSMCSFIEPEILKSNIETINNYIASYEPLKKYEYYLRDMLRLQDHILDEGTKKIVSSLSKGYSSLNYISSNLLNAEINYGTIQDENGETIQLISNKIRKYMKSPDREVRKKVYIQANEARKQFENTFGTNLSTYMSFQHELAKIEKYENLKHSSFEESNIPYEVNETLYKVVEKRIDVYYDYFRKMAGFLNVDKLCEYDKSANPFKLEKQYTIEEAQKLIKEATSIFGKEYSEVINKAFVDNWIDYCSYKGKANGAYCLLNYGDHPCILVNYQYGLEDVSTIVHELGHAVNSYFIQEKNYAHNYSTDYILAEIASLTNEIIFTNYLINISDDVDEKKTCIYRLLDTIQNNLFDACLEGKLENIIYAKLANNEVVSTQEFNDTIVDLKKQYYGDTVQLDEYSHLSWIPRQHYFAPFYLYKYAISVCVACYIGTRIANGDNDMKESYLKFLHLGNNDTPVNTLRSVGIDLLDEKLYDSAIDYFDEMLQKLYELSR